MCWKPVTRGEYAKATLWSHDAFVDGVILVSRCAVLHFRDEETREENEQQEPHNQA